MKKRIYFKYRYNETEPSAKEFKPAFLFLDEKGNWITNLNQHGTITVKCPDELAENFFEAKLIAAVYENNLLKSIRSSETSSLEVELALPDSLDLSKTMVKAFLWNNYRQAEVLYRHARLGNLLPDIYSVSIGGEHFGAFQSDVY